MYDAYGKYTERVLVNTNHITYAVEYQDGAKFYCSVRFSDGNTLRIAGKLSQFTPDLIAVPTKTKYGE